MTILGQSSGGTNVFAHLASESSRGLFHRAISLSGEAHFAFLVPDNLGIIISHIIHAAAYV